MESKALGKIRFVQLDVCQKNNAVLVVFKMLFSASLQQVAY
jgi:hypothetical protein